MYHRFDASVKAWERYFYVEGQHNDEDDDYDIDTVMIDGVDVTDIISSALMDRIIDAVYDQMIEEWDNGGD